MSQILYYFIRQLFACPSNTNLPYTRDGHCRIIYLSDEETNLPPRPPPFVYRPWQSDESDSDDHWQSRNPTKRNRRTRRYPFIKTEASLDGDVKAELDDDDDADLTIFNVDNDVD